MPAVEAVGGGAVVGLLVSLSILLVRSLVSGSAATAARYEAELARLREDRDRREAELRTEIQYWRDRAEAMT